MSLEDFFGDEEVKLKSDAISKVEIKKEQINEDQEGEEQQELPIRNENKEFVPKLFEMGEDIDNIFLLDVRYDRETTLAQCIFYHEPTRAVYKWNDTTGHRPYLYTQMSMDTLKQIPQVTNSKDFIKFIEVKKYDLLEDQEIRLTKVYGNNPLAIGGRPDSFREFINPSYEADIRYHFNYTTDKRLTPGTYYRVTDGKLISDKIKIDKNIENELLKEFENENQDELDMLYEYMPRLFQNIPDILRAAFDIEVGSKKGIMPNPNKAIEPIISIALVDSDGRKICWVLRTDKIKQEEKLDDIQVILFDNERELIEEFFAETTKYPIIISFNGDNFDAPYLFTRAQKLGIDYRDLPFKQKRNDVEFNNSIHIDLYRFFRQAAIRIYAFGAKYDNSSLNELARALLNKNKLEHPDVWINEMDLKTLVTYNVMDADLTLQLTQFDDNIVLNLMFILMRICKMPLFDFSRIAVSGWLQMWLIYEHRKRNYLVPRKEDILAMKGDKATSTSIIDGKNFQGAIVLDPTPGVWWDVRVLDFASLYPSIIKTKNLSYETINCHHEECKKHRVPEVNHWSCTRKNGLFAILLGFVRDTRVKWFKPRSGNTSLHPKEQRINQVIQSSLKVLINAGYGVFGSTTFDFYCPPVAESTTAYAREAITLTQNFAEKNLGVRVLYGDTDSLFLHRISEVQTQKLLDWGEATIGIELGTDYIFRYVIFSDRKKNYFGVTTNGKAIVKGLMGKKRNTPKIIRDHFDKTLEILIQVHTPEELELAKVRIKTLLQKMVIRLENGEFSVEDASIKTTISRKLKDYGTWTQTVQVVAQLIDKGIKKKGDLDIGDRIEFVKIGNPIRINIPKDSGLAFPEGSKLSTVIPVELIPNDIQLDGKPLLDMAESAFSQFVQSFGLSWEAILGMQSLDDWF